MRQPEIEKKWLEPKRNIVGQGEFCPTKIGKLKGQTGWFTREENLTKSRLEILSEHQVMFFKGVPIFISASAIGISALFFNIGYRQTSFVSIFESSNIGNIGISAITNIGVSAYRQKCHIGTPLMFLKSQKSRLSRNYQIWLQF